MPLWFHDEPHCLIDEWMALKMWFAFWSGLELAADTVRSTDTSNRISGKLYINDTAESRKWR
jgi:hypothetical protein